MTITQEQLEALERRLQQTIDEKVNALRTDLIAEARSIVESYQRSDRTASRLQDALDRIKQEVLRTVRSSVSTQIAAIRAQQDRDISQLTTTVTSTINERLRAFKSEVAEYTNNDRNSARDSQVVSLEHQIKLSLQQLDSTNASFQQQFSSVINMIRKEKTDISSHATDTFATQQQVDEEERKIKHLQAEIAQREKHLEEEKAFLKAQSEAFIKEKKQAERMRNQARRYGQDNDIEKSILKELQSIRRSLGSSVATEATGVVGQLKREVDLVAQERERMRSTREMMIRSMSAPGGDMSFSRYGVQSRFQPSMFP